MRNLAIIGLCLVCFLAGVGAGAGVAWMIAGSGTKQLSDTQRTLAEETGYGRGWNDGYEARLREEAIASEGRAPTQPSIDDNDSPPVRPGDDDD